MNENRSVVGEEDEEGSGSEHPQFRSCKFSVGKGYDLIYADDCYVKNGP